MGSKSLAALALGFSTLACPPLFAQDHAGATVKADFDPAIGWDEFEQRLRDTYAYIDRDDMDVDVQFTRSRTLALQAKDRSELRRILHQTALTFSDPHLIVGPFEDSDYNIVMTASDIAVSIVEDRAFIADVRRGSSAFENGLRPGDEIIAIDGVPAMQAALLPYGAVLSNPTPKQRDYGLTLAVNGQRAGNRRLTLRTGATSATHDVVLDNPRAYARAVDTRLLVDLEFVGERKDVAVLRLNNSLGNNDTIGAFDEALQRALQKQARAVILDMRETPSGGNTEVARSIMGHFITEAKPYQMHRVPVFEREFTVPRQFVEYVMPRSPHFGGPVFVLHGKWTGSMGEGIVIGMDAATNAISIGSDMGDLLGGLWNYDLEFSGARLDLGGEALFHVDGTAREDFVAQRPIMPASTASDGSDPAIHEALGLLGAR